MRRRASRSEAKAPSSLAAGSGLSQNVAIEEGLVPHRLSLIVVLLAKRDGVDPRRVPRKLSARIQPVDEIRDRGFAANAAGVADCLVHRHIFPWD